MSLTKDLAALKADILPNIPETIQTKMFADLEALAKSGLLERAPKTGQKLTDFTLQNPKGETVSLKQLRKNGPVVITFYRGGWCPYCNVELRAYQQVLDKIIAAGAALVAITPELPDASLSTTEKNDLRFEVLTDEHSKYAHEINIMFTISKEIAEIYKGFGIDVEAHNGTGQFNVPLAATFVVDKEGILQFAFTAADYTVRADPEEIIKELNSLN
ncbi:MAG: peroxiredoxin-like family protein [Desulfovibrio sp.]